MRNSAIPQVVTAFLLVLLFNVEAICQEPVPDSLSPVLTGPVIPGGLLLAANDTTDSDDDLDVELMDEYDDDQDAAATDVPDPLYYFNYGMYAVNDFLYSAAIKPVAQGYKAVMPTVARKGVRNFFHNLLFPVRFVNNLLQGKVGEAGEEVGIFLVNTTVGVLGFMQIAQNEFDMHTSDEDLGQTLGAWSVDEGIYLFFPIIGPTTFRDVVGMAGDYFLTPVNYVEPWELATGLKVLDGVNTASFRLGDYEALTGAAVDPYAALKNAYIQNRNKKIAE